MTGWKNFFRNKRNPDLTPEDLILDNDDLAASYVNPTERYLFTKIIAAGVLTTISILWGRSLFLQVSGNEPAGEFIPASRLIKGQRGVIYDANGQLLAMNVGSYNVFIEPYRIPEDEKEQTLTSLQNILGLERKILDDVIENNFFASTEIASDIDKDTLIALEVKKDSLPGVFIEEGAKRQYPFGESMAHILGYTGKLSQQESQQNPNYVLSDSIGKTGLEVSFESELKGTYGKKNLSQTEILTPAQSGNSLTLTIDAELQQKVFETLNRIAEENGVTKATAVAIDPRSGAVKSMVSLPTFDNNAFVGGITQQDYQSLITNPDNPLLNRAIGGEYAPGSTLKPLLAGAFLDEGLITETTTINDQTGRLIIPNRFNPDNPTVFPDWKIHGVSDVKKSISDSVNMFYYIYGGGYQDIEGLGIEKMSTWYRKFGLGSKTNISLPSEKSGTIPDPDWKQATLSEPWRLGDTYNASIGQGLVTTTPLQLAMYTAAIANGGTLYEPYIVSSMHNFDKSDIIKTTEPKVVTSDLLSPEAMRIVQEGMRQTVTDGSGRRLSTLSFPASGKTGTAQTGRDRNNAWFISYAPSDNPELALVVLFEEGDQGHLTSVPAAREILDWYWNNRIHN